MSIRASFQMAKASYGVVAQHPALLVFPILSSIAGLLITVSFALGALQLDLSAPAAEVQAAAGEREQIELMIGTGLFYFVTYFTVVFFNVALLFSTQSALEGRGARLGHGLAGAMSRLGAIAGWALLAAIVGVLLRAIERANPRLGGIVSAVFGLTFTALSFFVVPVLVVEGLGPVAALKRSKEILEESWLDAFVGHVSLAWIGIVAFLIPIGVAWLAWITPGLESTRLVAVIVILVGGFAFAAAMSGAADTVFKLLLYRRAVDAELPPGVGAAIDAAG